MRKRRTRFKISLPQHWAWMDSTQAVRATPEHPITIIVREEMVLVCPRCGKTMNMPLSELERRHIDFGLPVQVSCSCAALFQVAFERRGNRREDVYLLGHFVWAGDCAIILVRNLSPGGVGFHVLGENLREVLEVRDLGVERIIEIGFEMDDQDRSLFWGGAIVRHINMSYVGAQFWNIEEPMKRLLAG